MQSLWCLHYLLTHGARTNVKNKVCFFLTKSSFFSHGLTPILFAISKSNITAVYALINAKADIKVLDDNGWSALHWAAQTQNPKIVEAILGLGLDPNLADFEGSTPLHIAGGGKSPEIVRLLIRAGADPNIRNEFGTKAGDECAQNGLGAALRDDTDVVSV